MKMILNLCFQIDKGVYIACEKNLRRNVYLYIIFPFRRNYGHYIDKTLMCNDFISKETASDK